MIWTLEDFEQACLRLSQAFDRVQDDDSNSSSSSSSSALAWTVVDAQQPYSSRPVKYLVHRHQARVSNGARLLNHGGPEEAIPQDDNDDNGDNNCTKLYDDPDVVVHQNGPNQDDETTSKPSSSSWEWNFSVVYSETWQAPVLYFHVHNDVYRGEPCTRTQIVRHLTKTLDAQNNNVSDSWDFVSQDEHPVTRLPSFFLHPCRTNERLQHLSNKDNKEEEDPAVVLLQWMSLILPSVGLSVSSADFVKVRTLLLAMADNND